MEFTVYFVVFMFYFFLNETATTAIYTYCHTLSLHDALPISRADPTLIHRSAVRPDGSEPTYGRGLSRYVPAAVAVRERSTRQAAGQADDRGHRRRSGRRLPRPHGDRARQQHTQPQHPARRNTIVLPLRRDAR